MKTSLGLILLFVSLYILPQKDVYARENKNILDSFSDKYKITVLLESSSVIPLSKKNDDLKSDIDNDLKLLSDTLDCIPIFYKKENLLLLQRKFTSPENLPDVTYSECETSHQNIIRLIRPYMPSPPVASHTNMALDIADVLTPEQLQTMTQSPGLPLATLTQNQRYFVWRMSMEMYLGIPLAFPIKTENLFSQIRQEGKIKSVDIGSPLYNGPFQDSWSQVNSNGIFAQIIPNILNYIPCSIRNNESINNNDNYKKLNKNESDRLLSGSTIKEILQKINNKADKRLIWRISPGIEDKRVMISGYTYANPDKIAYGIAEIYGLKVSKRGAKEHEITIPVIGKAETVHDLPGLIQVAIPSPIYRYLHIKDLHGNSPHLFIDSAGENTLAAEWLTRSAQVEMYSRLLMALPLSNVLKDAKNSVPSFSELSLRIQNIFAIRCFIQLFLKSMQQMPTTTPDYVTFFDQGYLFGGWSEYGKTRRFSADILIKRPNGQISRAGVMTNGPDRSNIK